MDYMYNFYDYDTNRFKVREKFVKEMNKKISLKDIGETLDDLVLENKSKYYKHYSLQEHHNAQPERPTKDYTSNDFQWSGRVLKLIDPKSPLFYEDPSIINQATGTLHPKFEKIKEQIEHNDATRDYSEHSLTQDEKTEI